MPLRLVFITFSLLFAAVVSASVADTTENLHPSPDTDPSSRHLSDASDYTAEDDGATANDTTATGSSVLKTDNETPKSVYSKYDDERWWLNLARKGKLNLKDTTVVYPKFIKLCVDVYNWGDNFFNPYDTAYVAGTGKRWKARIINDNWLDSYIMRLPEKMQIDMFSNPYSNIGGYLQYMAVSVGYTIDFENIFGGQTPNHKKWEFGFNCARFNIEIRYQENSGGTYLRRFGDYKDGKIFKEKFPGVQLQTFGLEAIYFLNCKRYSHGAAYNFSKFQKKSQGSFIAGFAYSNLRSLFDFSMLPDKFIPYLTIPASNYLFHYNSYAAVLGYGYNWVIRPKLLFNFTFTPSFGASHCYEDSLDGEKWMFSMNVGAKTSLIYNLNNWFFCINGKMNGQWYRSGTFSLFTSILNFSANVGIRF